MDTQCLYFTKTDTTAVIPTRATSDSAGYDLSAKKGETIIVPAGGKELVSTGLRVLIPEGCYGRIAPRSGMSWKNHTSIEGGVIDRDFAGELRVIIFNHAKTDLEIHPDQRVAQLIVERNCTPRVFEIVADPQTGKRVYQRVESAAAPPRGTGGFGSTGSLQRSCSDDDNRRRSKGRRHFENETCRQVKSIAIKRPRRDDAKRTTTQEPFSNLNSPWRLKLKNAADITDSMRDFYNKKTP